MPQYDLREKRNKRSIAILLVVAGAIILQLLFFGRSANGVYSAVIAFAMLLCGVLLLAGIFTLFTFRRTAELKTRAIHGDQKLLAAEQPVADDHALPLPTTIKLRLDKKRFFLSNGILYLIPYGLITFFLYWNGKALVAHLIGTFVGALIFAVLMTAVMYFFSGRHMDQILTHCRV